MSSSNPPPRPPSRQLLKLAKRVRGGSWFMRQFGKTESQTPFLQEALRPKSAQQTDLPLTPV